MFSNLRRRASLLVMCLVVLTIGASAAVHGPSLALLDPGSLAVTVHAATTGCSTIYTVTNSSANDAVYVHEFKDLAGTSVFSFSDSLGARSVNNYDTRTLSGLPDGFR